MKKTIASFLVIASSAAYVLYQHFGGTQAPSAATGAPSTAPTSGSVSVSEPAPQPATLPPTPAPKPKPTPAPTPTPAPAPKPKGQYADGTYTGTPADAYYGTIQVQAVVTNGKLSDVIFLQYPNDRRTSIYINEQAMPLLKQEAIQAQSANVSGVSGASDSSLAFVQSLGSALSKAKN